MIQQDKAAAYFEQLQNIAYAPGLTARERFIELRELLQGLYQELIADELQFFSGLYASSIYIFDRFSVPHTLAEELHALRFFSNKILRNRDYPCTGEDALAAVKVLAQAIHFFSQQEIPSSLLKVLASANTLRSSEFQSLARKNIFSCERAVAQKIGRIEQNSKGHSYCKILFQTEEFGSIGVIFRDKLAVLGKMLWKGATVNLFDLVKLPEKENIFLTSDSSLVVIEPDILMDVTEIAECFQNSSSNPKLYFLKKFFPSLPSAVMMAGNIVNACFDEILTGSETDFGEIFSSVLRYKPLATLSLIENDKNSLETIKAVTEKQYEALKKIVAGMNFDRAGIEPTFISAKYGLQGRLDALLEDENDDFRKTVVELKSGRSPQIDSFLFQQNSPRGLWSNHYAQTTCYNLLLDSAYEERTGSSTILYAQAENYPLRNAPNIAQHKQDVLMLRNWIIALERALLKGNFSLLESFTPDKFGPIPAYALEKLEKFSRLYSGLNELERDYFHGFLQLILQEQYCSRIGNKNSNGFAALWRESLEEKTASMSILSYLKLDEENSDLESFHLVFDRTEKTPLVSTLRTGDIALIYALDANNEAKPLSQQILKCTIKEITHEKIVISLRNKHTDKRLFLRELLWVLEPDNMEAGYNSLIQSLIKFLLARSEKKALLFGQEEPEFREDLPWVYEERLAEEQNELLNRALSARNYFLLQGPPGTGKTSVMLHSIVKHLHERSEENLLVLAFTNRAVDEICASVSRITPSVEFMRLGNKDSGGSGAVTLAQAALEGSLEELSEKFACCRIIVGTVSSVLSNPELFSIKKFTTAVVDEASQLLEPHLAGILTEVDKFILIGDEKQLPAVTQNTLNSSIQSDSLNEILLADFRSSLFERLLHICESKGWNSAYGMLHRQGRMHVEIQNLVNEIYYEGRLMPLHDWQSEPEKRFSQDSANPVESMLASSRIVFIPSEPEKERKLNVSEAQCIVSLAEKIAELYSGSFSAHTLGIISPFRSQCAEILRRLPENLRNFVTVDTVERFQGSERDIILVSFAINNAREVDLIKSIKISKNGIVDRRLNVTLTRARKHIILHGNKCLHSMYFPQSFNLKNTTILFNSKNLEYSPEVFI